EVVDYLRAGEADVLWLLDVSRGDREAGRWLDLLNYCRDHGILIYLHLSKRMYDVRIPADWKELASSGVDAAHDSDEKSLKIRLANEEAAREGLHQGGPAPFGYRRVFNEEEDRHDWLKDETTAPIVKDITERAARGETL